MAKGRKRSLPASSRLNSGAKRGKLTGGSGEGLPKAARRDAPRLAPLMSRLRRLEVVVLFLTAKLKLSPGALDAMLDKVLQLHEDVPDGSEGSNKEV